MVQIWSLFVTFAHILLFWQEVSDRSREESLLIHTRAGSKRAQTGVKDDSDPTSRTSPEYHPFHCWTAPSGWAGLNRHFRPEAVQNNSTLPVKVSKSGVILSPSGGLPAACVEEDHFVTFAMMMPLFSTFAQESRK